MRVGVLTPPGADDLLAGRAELFHPRGVRRHAVRAAVLLRDEQGELFADPGAEDSAGGAFLSE
ncbi:hypothetical protein Are01nite_51330 [Actinoplanes regularis]|nr:hypothetical protein Are01nite_51330 [Actinoplanes regularis]